jgi:hypothetical protein
VTSHGKIDFSSLIGDVACILWNEPNPHRSSRRELRWGNNGSRSVDLEKGTWFDHEAQEGGGCLDLIARETGRTGCDAITWMKEQGLPVDDSSQTNGKTNSPHKSSGKPKRTLVKTYDYVDELGQLLSQVCRIDPKDFRQRRPDPDDPGKRIWNVDGVRQVPYRLPELQQAVAAETWIFIAEGEKDVDALVAIGCDATCNAQGAGKWPGGLSDFFRGALVCIIPDYDEPGRSHCAKVGAALIGVARNVKVLELPGLPEKGDFSDWAAANAGPNLDARFWQVFEERAEPFEEWKCRSRSEETGEWQGF